MRVVIASYPKSGRTWLSFLIANYLNQIHQLVPRVNFRTVYRIIQSDGAPIKPLDCSESGLIPRLSASHKYPREIEAERVIRLTRDPYDLLVSDYFHNSQQHHNFRGTIGEFIRDRRWGVLRYRRYCEQWRRATVWPTIAVQYEQMHRDAASQLVRVLEFCDLAPIDAAAVSAAVRLSRFDIMRRRELKGPRIPSHDYDRGNEAALRVRSGTVGDASRILSRSDVDFISQKLGIDPIPVVSRPANADSPSVL